jgi:hypothetical protein
MTPWRSLILQPSGWIEPFRLQAAIMAGTQQKRPPGGGLSADLIALVIRLRLVLQPDCACDRP